MTGHINMREYLGHVKGPRVFLGPCTKEEALEYFRKRKMEVFQDGKFTTTACKEVAGRYYEGIFRTFRPEELNGETVQELPKD